MNKENNPLVSVIVITYNSEKHVVETLESIKEQTYKNIELIISDDCSIDKTINICEQWLAMNAGRFYKSKLLTVEKNKGIPSNCNRGIHAAEGEWIKIIAGDDALFPYLITSYIQYINSNLGVKFLHSNILSFRNYLKEGNEVHEESRTKHPFNRSGISPNEQLEILLRANPIATPTVFLKKSIFSKVGYFDERYPLWEDRPMWIRIAENNIKLHYIDIVGVKYRVYDNSVQKNKGKNRVYNEFTVQKNRAYYDNYLSKLPIRERIRRMLAIKRILFINVVNVRCSYKLARILDYLTKFQFLRKN